MAGNGQRLLDELGVVRYRLRRPASSAGSVVAEPAPIPFSPGTPPSVSEPVVAPGPAAATAAVPLSAPRVRLAAPMPAEWPTAATVIWSQVMNWLGLSADEIEWLPSGDERGLPLPDPAQWNTATGRRALWLALKRSAVELAAAGTGNSDRRDHGRRAD